MINSKRWSWEECKRDSSIPEKWFELLNKCKKSGKWSTLCFMEWQGSQKRIQGSLQFYPFSWILQFSSSKSIKCFFINLKQFQTLPWVWSKLNRQPWACSEISRLSTLYQHDTLSQLSKDILKNYHRNLTGAFGVFFANT